jgi:uncharacterized membrane protein YczE
MRAIEHAPTRHTQLPGNRPSQQFGLVEPALADATGAGGCPRDHIDLAATGRPEPLGHDARQQMRHTALVAVLQAEHHLAPDSLEREGGEYPTLGRDRRGARQREATAMAQEGAGLIATGAGGGEEHGRILPRGCDTVRGSVVRMFLPLPADRMPERVVRCVIGLAFFGLGISMFLAGNLGLAPWDVFHKGVSKRTGIPVGIVIEITGVCILLLWIPLRERLGLGTVLNAIEIGLVVYLIDDHLPTTDLLVPRALYVVGGLLSIAVGSGLYIGAGLGSGPRDGLMLGLSKRNISIRVARTGVEVVALVVGLLLGGTVGVGTVAFTFGIGPLCQLLMPPLRMRGQHDSPVGVH